MSRIRAALLGLSFCLSLVAATAAVLAVLEASDLGDPEVPLDAAAVALEELQRLSEASESSGSSTSDIKRVVFLGDSTTLALPPRLQAATKRFASGRPVIEVYSLAAPGQTPFDQYFLSEEVIRAGPDGIVVSINLAAFSDMFRLRFNKPELAGWIPPARLPEAMRLPLGWIGLSLDRMLLYVSMVELGADRMWHRLRTEQARFNRARTRLEDRARNAFGIGRSGDYRVHHNWARMKEIHQTPTRYSLKGAYRAYGPVLAGVESEHPILAVLSALLGAYRRAEIPTLAYVVPVNVEHLEHLGIDTEGGLVLTLERIEAVARKNGARFADLHSILPDAAFRDAGGHLHAHGGELSEQRPLVETLARRMVTLIRTEAPQG